MPKEESPGTEAADFYMLDPLAVTQTTASKHRYSWFKSFTNITYKY